MNAILNWIDDRSGLVTAVRQCLDAPVRGKPSWARVLPCTILFTFLVQAITGLFLWMYYSPSAQTAWESVYYLQYHVTGGWLLRAVHHYSAQVMLVLIGIYLIKMIVTGAYRAPREFVFWVTVLMGLVCLGAMLTGDLLAWDQNSVESTKVRVSFLNLLPGVGGGLSKLAVGGSSFGHLTLTRFVALHVGVLTAGLMGLLLLHIILARRAESADAAKASDNTTAIWPGQVLRSTVASLVVLAVIFLLAMQHGVSGGQRGVELGAPADPASTYPAARPEWAFLGLYAFSNEFSGENKILPIFVFPTLLMGIVLAMPLLGKWKRGHYFNLGFTAFILVALVALSLKTVAHDRDDKEHQKALAIGHQDAVRVRQLAARPERIPATGARTLLREDPKTEGRRLFAIHCASCHDHTQSAETDSAETDFTAPNLFGYGSRKWVAGWLDVESITGPNYYGNTAFRSGDMVQSMKDAAKDADEYVEEDFGLITRALSAEAQLRSQRAQDEKDAVDIEEGAPLLTVYGCTDCHKFHDEGELGKGPDLTGYASRQWTIDIIADPAHQRFYSETNDRMPAYRDADQPEKSLLKEQEIEMIADWLRGEWYEPAKK